MSTQTIKNFFNENSNLITGVGGTLLILSTLGFNLNVVEAYKSLDTESKILFMGLINFVITITTAVYILSRISKQKGKK